MHSGDSTHRSSPFSIASIVASMTMAAIGSGLMFVYSPYMLAQSADAAWAPGAAVTAVAFGGLVGCVVTGPLIQRVGHARLFACSMAIVIIAAALIAANFSIYAWIFARGLYGAAANCNFIIAQSWLNHAASNTWRGRAMSFFYMAYVLGLGCGSWLFGQIATDGNLTPLLTIVFTALAILPIGLTRLPNPPAPARVNVDVAMAWRISPVGLIGVLASGGLSMVVQGFVPIYATTSGVPQRDLGLLMFVMQTGLLFVQYPLGILSDRMDRRRVLLITCIIIVGAGSAALFASFTHMMLFMLVFLVFSGAIETIYSIANAHSNDRADPGDYVPLSSTLLVAWSAAATVVPLAVTALMPILGPKTFIMAALVVATAYGLFTFWRLNERDPVPSEERETFGLRSAQLPNAATLTDPEALARDGEA